MTSAEIQRPITVSSLQEARFRIHQMQKENANQRDILKTKFEFGGKVFGFNVVQLSDIKKEFGEQTGVVEYTLSDMFKMFKNGLNSVDVIIKTNKSFDVVKTVNDQYLELENMTPVPKFFVEKMYSLARKVGSIDGSYNHVINRLDTAVDSHVEFEQYKYRCCVCGKLIRISEGEWPDLKQFMISNHFGHHSCFS